VKGLFIVLNKKLGFRPQYQTKGGILYIGTHPTIFQSRRDALAAVRATKEYARAKGYDGHGSVWGCDTVVKCHIAAKRRGKAGK
jgi:hypothetical protein